MKSYVKTSDLLQLINKKEFNNLCQKWEVNKGVRWFNSWNHLYCLISVFLLKLDSLREVEQTLGVPKSTFSDANCNRHFGFFEELCELVLKSLKPYVAKRKVKGAINNLLAIDASTCDVHGSLASEWLWKSKSSQSNKASVSLHAVYNIDSDLIEDFRLFPSKVMETTVARQFDITPGSTYVFDRAYRQLTFWWKIVNGGAHFVSRLINCEHRRKERKKIIARSPNKNGVLYDDQFKPSATAFYENPTVPKHARFRYIIYKDPVSGKIFDFVTSNFKASAQTIANTYKRRWSIELLFRWLKGHLNIRYIPSRNKNSVKVQLISALLLKILIHFYMLKNAIQSTPWEFLRTLRANLLKKGIKPEFRTTGPSKPSTGPPFQRVRSIK